MRRFRGEPALVCCSPRLRTRHGDRFGAKYLHLHCPENDSPPAAKPGIGFGVRLVSRGGRWKMVGAAGLAPASSRSQAECLKLLGYAPKNGCGCRGRTDRAQAYETRRNNWFYPQWETGTSGWSRHPPARSWRPRRSLELERGKLDTTAGFEPANIGFAGRPLGPLGHVVEN